MSEMSRGFVHLHLHSEYSLLDGACRITEIPKAAKEAGHTAVALTDHGVMYGAVDFYKACVKEGVRPILGCEVYVAPRTRFDKTHEQDSSSYHLVLLVQNEVGYRNLIDMASKGFTEGFYSKPRVDMDLLETHHEGLIALSGCLGGCIPKMLAAEDERAAEQYALKMRDIFGEDHFYLELQNHGLELQETVLRGLAALSEKTGIPLVATNDVHYLRRSDADTQAILMCIQTNHVISDGRPFGFETDEFYYKSTEEMEELFGSYKGALENTVKIAEMCAFDFDFGKTYFPRYIPENGQTAKAFLRALALEGLKQRAESGHIVYTKEHPADEYKLRLEYEMLIISKMGYEEYYLIVWDFVHYAKSHGIPVGPGRGSGAGSLIAYLLYITDVDSIRYNLLFERFLNPERVSMPDFDIDFCYDRRDEVIQYVSDKYGHDHVAQIITFGTMAARAAVRDVGRALGMAYGDVDAVAKAIPQRLGITLEEALREPDLKTMYESSPIVKNLIDVSLAVEGMPRHASTHAAGVVITDKSVSTYVPLAENGGTVVTQFDMDTVAALGLLKFDFLALRYLTILSDAEKLIRKTQPSFDLSAVSDNDAATYEMISQGHTSGVFQLESGGMRQMLTNFQPRSLEDIMIAIALYRPGPMDSIPRFLENRRNRSAITYSIPQLRDILDSTCGCIIYQEQVMQIFRTVAFYSYGKADMVRKAMSKKKTEEMEKERSGFLEGAARNFIPKEDAAALFDEMAGFAKYAFNKSHAAAYSMISYRAAYLKCNYPKQYLAALLTSVIGVAAKTAEYIGECGRFGIRVLPPDINESSAKFVVQDNDIRFGLLALKNVGHTFVEAILTERKKRPYDSFIDFALRLAGTELNKRQVEALIKAGAFDELGVNRAALLASYETIIDSVVRSERGNIAGQIGLFDNDPDSGGFEWPDIPDFSLREKLIMEKECSGFFFSGHMLDHYKKHLQKLNPVEINNIILEFEENSGVYADKQTVTVAGVITRRSDKTTKKGETMSFMTLEDRYGEIELILFPALLQSYGGLLLYDSAVVVTGEISLREEEAPKLVVRTAAALVSDHDYSARTEEKTIEPVMKAPESRGPEMNNKEKKLYLKVRALSGGSFEKTVNLLEIFTGDVEVIFYDESTRKYIRHNGLRAAVSELVLNELASILGDSNVVYR